MIYDDHKLATASDEACQAWAVAQYERHGYWPQAQFHVVTPDGGNNGPLMDEHTANASLARRHTIQGKNDVPENGVVKRCISTLADYQAGVL